MADTGIIIVSHSENIAKGVVELASEMSNDRVVLKPAGGTGDGRLGTNALMVQEAIESLADCKNILIYCDLGSSVLSSETAIELIEDDDEELAEKVKIVDCPLVEGAFYGAVQASVTDDPEKIIEESKKARDLHKG